MATPKRRTPNRETGYLGPPTPVGPVKQFGGPKRGRTTGVGTTGTRTRTTISAGGRGTYGTAPTSSSQTKVTIRPRTVTPTRAKTIKPRTTVATSPPRPTGKKVVVAKTRGGGTLRRRAS